MKVSQTKNALRQLQILIMGDLPEELFATSGAGESGSMNKFIERLPNKEKGLFSSIRIQDAWDSVFYYKYISNDKLLIWSFGPNKADDEARGDDISIVITRKDLEGN